MTPKEIAEKLVKDKEYLERSGGFLTSKMPILAEAYLALERRCEKLERVAETARAISICSEFDSDICGYEELQIELAELGDT